MRLILATGETLTVEDGATLGSIKVKTADPLGVWAKITAEALSEIGFANDDSDEVFATFTDLVCPDSISITKDGEEYLVTFAIRQKTEIEILKEQLAAAQEAIDDLTMTALEG